MPGRLRVAHRGPPSHRVDEGCNREDQKLQCLVNRCGRPLRLSGVAPDQIEADHRQIHRHEVGTARTNPERVSAEQDAPGGEIDKQIVEIGAPRRKQERGRVGADNGEQHVQPGAEHLSQPKREQAYGSNAGGCDGGTDETVVHVRPVHRQEENDDAGTRQERCIATLHAYECQTDADQRQPADGGQQHLPLGGQPA